MIKWKENIFVCLVCAGFVLCFFYFSIVFFGHFFFRENQTSCHHTSQATTLPPHPPVKPKAWSTNMSNTATNLAFVLLGGASLVPWQAYISALDFFMILLPGQKIQYMIPIVNMLCILVTTFMVVLFAQVVSPTKRIVASGLFLMAALLVVPFQNYYLLHNHMLDANGTLLVHPSTTSGKQQENTCYWVVLVSLMCCATAASIMQSSLFGLAGAMSETQPALTAWLTCGQGIAGVGVVALRCLTKFGIGDAKAAVSTLLFFGLGFVWVAVAMLVFYVAVVRHNNTTTTTLLSSVNTETEYVALENNNTKITIHVSKTKVLGQIWRQAGTATLVFTTCISCFPGLTASLVSTTFHLGSWFPILLVLVYNVGDLVGKTLPQYMSVFNTKHRANVHLPLAALCHVGFVPVFILMLTKVIVGDVVAFVVVGLLGVTTGYLGCSAMVAGPTMVAAADREIAGTLDVLALVFGLTLGSIVGLVISSYH